MYDTRLKEVTIDLLDVFSYLQRRIFPITYPEKFYSDLIENESSGAHLIIYRSEIAGVISHKKIDDASIYLMTFGLETQFRGKGIGRKALRFFEEKMFTQHFTETIHLHVHVENLGAKCFYETMGYKFIKIVENYYDNIFPRDAYYLIKQL